MKTAVVVTVLAILAQFALGQSAQPASTPVTVPDAATAVKLAEKVLANVYGKKKIEAEKPFEASLSGGIWHVSGTLYCGKDRSLKRSPVCGWGSNG
jgi:NTF2 fold immunity protein